MLGKGTHLVGGHLKNVQSLVMQKGLCSEIKTLDTREGGSSKVNGIVSQRTTSPLFMRGRSSLVNSPLTKSLFEEILRGGRHMLTTCQPSISC
jgi:hypothetical protein